MERSFPFLSEVCIGLPLCGIKGYQCFELSIEVSLTTAVHSSAVFVKALSNKQLPSYNSSAQFNQPLFNNHPSNNYPTINNNMRPDEDLEKENDNKYFVLETDK